MAVVEKRGDQAQPGHRLILTFALHDLLQGGHFLKRDALDPEPPQPGVRQRPDRRSFRNLPAT